MGCMFSRNPGSRRSSLSSINETILEEDVFLLTEEHIFELIVQMNIEEHRQTVKVLTFNGVHAAERFIKEKLRYDVYTMFDHRFLMRTQAARQAMLEEAQSVVQIPEPKKCVSVPVPEPERDSPEPDYSFYTESEFVSSNDIAVDSQELDANTEFKPHVLVENHGFFSFDPLRSTFKSMPSVRIAAVAVAPSGFVSAFCLDSTYKSNSAADTEATGNTAYLVDTDDEENVAPEQTPLNQLDDLCAKFTKRTLARSSTFKMEEFSKRAESCQFSPTSGFKKNLRQTFESTASLYVAPCQQKVSVLMCASENHLGRPTNFSMDSEVGVQDNKENQPPQQQAPPSVAPTRRYNMKMLKAKAAFNAMRDTAKSMPALDTDQLFAEAPTLSSSERFLVQLADSEVVHQKKSLTPSSSFKFSRDDSSANPRRAVFIAKSGAASLGALHQAHFGSETNVARSGRSLTPSASFKMSNFTRKE